MFSLISAQIQNIKVTVLTDTSVKVSWDDPQFSSITHYVINYNLQINKKIETMSILETAPANSAVIHGLMNSGQLIFLVKGFGEFNGTPYVLKSSVLNVILLKTKCSSPSKENSEFY